MYNEWDRKKGEKIKLRIKNVSSFVVERFCPLIQMKSIFYFIDLKNFLNCMIPTYVSFLVYF